MDDIDDILKEWQSDSSDSSDADLGSNDPLEALVDDKWHENETSLTQIEESKRQKVDPENSEEVTSEDAELGDTWASEVSNEMVPEDGDDQVWGDIANSTSSEKVLEETDWGDGVAAQSSADADLDESSSVVEEISDEETAPSDEWADSDDLNRDSEEDDWGAASSSEEDSWASTSTEVNEKISSSVGRVEETVAATSKDSVDSDNVWGDSPEESSTVQEDSWGDENSSATTEEDSWGSAESVPAQEEDSWGGNQNETSPEEDSWGAEVESPKSVEDSWGNGADVVPAEDAWGDDTASSADDSLSTPAAAEEDWDLNPPSESAEARLDDMLDALNNDPDLNEEDEVKSVETLVSSGPSILDRVRLLPGAALTLMIAVTSKPLTYIEPSLRPYMVEKTGLTWYNWAGGLIMAQTFFVVAQCYFILI